MEGSRDGAQGCDPSTKGVGRSSQVRIASELDRIMLAESFLLIIGWVD